MSRILGIDLGTSNTVMAVCIDQTPTIIPNAEGERSTPSLVGIDATTGRVIVGASAKRQAALNPRGTIFSVKRIMGRTYDQVEQDLRYLPYEVVRAPDGDAHVRVGKRTFTPADISAYILSSTLYVFANLNKLIRTYARHILIAGVLSCWRR